MGEQLRWRRDERWVHRLVHDHVALMSVGGEQRTLGGLAVAVWLVLEQPGDTAEVHGRILELWPDQHLGITEVADTLELLVEHGVVEAT